jgi:hypothetical protein
MNRPFYAPQQDIRQREGKALLPSAFARLNSKSAVHQQTNFGAKHECSAALFKSQSVTQYGETKRVAVYCKFFSWFGDPTPVAAS